MAEFDDFLAVVDEDEFDERPVDIVTFVEGEDFLKLPPLSEAQYKLVTAMTQIYKLDTLVNLFGPMEADRLWRMTVNEVVAQWGKGSGKDYCSAIAVARIVYLLLCLKKPAEYFHLAPGTQIAIINVAINAQQAKNVFFAGLIERITTAPWFVGKYSQKADLIEFDKNITCYSGHSERESWEGYNVICVILDEIAGFAIENTTGHDQAKTADAIYKMYSNSVMSRFDETGKIILLSFPRFKGDYIQQRYDEVVADKEVQECSHTFKLNDDLPDGIEENEFVVNWEIDKVIAYAEPNIYATKLPSWYANPTKTINSYKKGFFKDPIDTLARFACMPPDAIDAFFKSREKVEKAFNKQTIPFKSDWSFNEWFQPDKEKQYYLHVDLGHKHDRAAVAMCHVETWVSTKYIGDYADPAPLVKVDAVRYWTPKPNQDVDFTEIKTYILSLRERGFNIKLVTFDQWQSIEMANALIQKGLESEKLPVAKKHYEDLALLVAEERIKGYHIGILIEELLQLRIIKGDKVDHPRKGGKDLADAVCGAAYNAVAYTPRATENLVVEAHYLERGYTDQTNKVDDQLVIKPPKSQMPDDLASFIMSDIEII